MTCTVIKQLITAPVIRNYIIQPHQLIIITLHVGIVTINIRGVCPYPYQISQDCCVCVCVCGQVQVRRKSLVIKQPQSSYPTSCCGWLCCQGDGDISHRAAPAAVAAAVVVCLHLCRLSQYQTSVHPHLPGEERHTILCTVLGSVVWLGQRSHYQ